MGLWWGLGWSNGDYDGVIGDDGIVVDDSADYDAVTDGGEGYDTLGWDCDGWW